MQQQARVCRCPWVDLTKSDYIEYHDREWGVPVHDDRLLFELLILEGAQAGLSWYTVLRKRAAYRLAFDHFDPVRVARYDAQRVEELLRNPGIIRHRHKVRAAIHNAQRFLDLQRAFGSFATYIWQFVDGKPLVHDFRTLSDYPTTSPEAEAMSKSLHQRGFRFVGATICYAYMQATGLVNDHAVDCFRRQEILAAYTKM